MLNRIVQRAGLALAAALLAHTAHAQPPAKVVADDGWCSDHDGDSNRERHCEVREATWSPTGTIQVDATPNGGIQVEGWVRNEIRLRAKVVAMADTEADARALASEVSVETAGGVRARGPESRRRRSWWVSYRLSVPRRAALDLRSHNGGIAIKDVEGEIAFATTNGGVTLQRLAGDVHGRTTNGGLKVGLTGRRWEGRGLDVETTNGGIVLDVPEGYNAHLETGTVNGGLDLDFPVTVSGHVRRRLAVDLGSGGPTVRVMTTNGGVRLRRASGRDGDEDR